MINEMLLSFIWKQRLLLPDVITTDKQRVMVLSPGIQNCNQGPDFINSKLSINDNIWFGNVEIHVKSSDWFLHCHQLDANFSNVICHVVWINDAEVFSLNGDKIPTIELSSQILPQLIDNYMYLMNSANPIPCAKLISNVQSYVIFDMLESSFFEMLNYKIKTFNELLLQAGNNIDELCYQLVARAFGFKINNDAFEATAKSLPFNLLKRYRNDMDVVDALLMGQANLLDETFVDDYPKYLFLNYSFYRIKHSLNPQIVAPWKMLRLHPANFPCIRVAQFSAFLLNGFDGIDSFLSVKSADQLYEMFIHPVNSYWNNHLRFDKVSPEKSRCMGRHSVDLLIINAVVPLIYFYSVQHNLSQLTNLAIDIMESLSPENNNVIRMWESLNINPLNAVHSQSLMYIKANYCDKYRCLDCKIGSKIIRS